MIRTSGNVRTYANEPSVEPLSATTISTLSDCVWAITDGKKRRNIASPFQLSMITLQDI